MNRSWSRQVYKFNSKHQSLVLRHKNALRKQSPLVRYSQTEIIQHDIALYTFRK